MTSDQGGLPMARTRETRPRPLDEVEPGDLFALPLANGLWGACLVLRKISDPDNPRVLVRASAWIGDAPPDDLTDPRLRAPLILTHRAWGGSPFVNWVSDPVPADAVSLGRVSL